MKYDFDIKVKIVLNTTKIVGIMALFLGSAVAWHIHSEGTMVSVIGFITAMFANRDYQDRKNITKNENIE